MKAGRGRAKRAAAGRSKPRPPLDKSDLRARFTPGHQAPPSASDAGDVERLAAQLGDNVGQAVKIATQLGLVLAETVALRMMEMLSPPGPLGGDAARQAAAGAASVLGSARRKLPDLNAQAASRITDVVVASGLAALQAAQHAVEKTRRPG